MGYKKNTGSQYATLAGIKAADGTALTGLSYTIKRSLDGGAQATAGGTMSELAGGQYSFAYAAADLNGLDCSSYFTASTAVPVNYTIVTDTKVVSDLNDASVANIWAQAISDLSSVPTSTDTAINALAFIFMWVRNKLTFNGSTGVETLYKNDSSTTVASRTCTDDGTTTTKPKLT
ncbi:MAG: hypothetical protein KGL39_17140 [Patescibacteria group bacterium]|nr:hypothetical protein [Patescibacteria group bacterium]